MEAAKLKSALSNLLDEWGRQEEWVTRRSKLYNFEFVP